MFLGIVTINDKASPGNESSPNSGKLDMRRKERVLLVPA
jgi:hypothetical protein